MKARAALFSLGIEILDSPLSKFGNVNVRRSADGIGTSGLSISQLSFDVPEELYAPRAAKTVVTGVNGLPTYYIDSRSKSKGIVSVTCLDRLAFADVDFPIDKCLILSLVKYPSKDKFPKTGIAGKAYLDTAANKYYKWNGKGYDEMAEADYKPALSISEVTELIVNTVGLARLTGIPPWLTEIPRAKLQCTCSEILSFIAETCCGFFYMTDGNVCTFVPYGSYSASMAVKEHTALDIGIEYAANGILCTDGNGVQYSQGDVGYSYDTLQINSDLITQAGCEEIWGRASGKTLTQFKCDKAVVPSIPYPAELIMFAQGYEFIAHSINCKLSACGIIASLSGNAPSDGEIGSRHRLTRNKVELGKKSGSIMHTKYQGDIVLDDEED